MNSKNKKILASLLLVSITNACSIPNEVTSYNTKNKESDNFEVKRIRKISGTPAPTAIPSPYPVPVVSSSPVTSPTASPSTSTNRIINFSGYDWLVRNTASKAGPGPNYFSNSTDNVFVDSLGQLHLKITNRNGNWYCGSIGALKSLGYGKYKFYIASRLDQLPKNVVMGLFTWDDSADYNHREIDIEFSKWGYADNQNSQYVVQPYDNVQNVNRFNTQMAGDYSTHSFDWKADRIDFQSYFGHYNTLPDLTYLINSWTYTGSDIPVSGNEKIALNLWNFQGVAPTSEVEVIIKKFEFTPANTLFATN